MLRRFENTNWTWVAIAGGSVAALPLAWNIVARNEYKNKTMTRIFGSPRAGCYALAAAIFCASLARDKLVEMAIQRSKPAALIDGVDAGTLRTAGLAITGAGLSLVLASFYRLGVTGTYLGDYFGILLPARITAFPYNVFSDPMYDGASVGFLGLAVYENSPIGVLLAGWVWLVYRVSTTYFEGPFTSKIYAEAAARGAKEN
jgi:phosphatidylethanolamine N-methyltransferase